MRVITGDFKGKKIEMPVGYDIRPTTEKVKEALFSIISSHINIDDTVCCDLFSGTGNLGIEALSRGAAKCYFCDNSRDSINLMKRNIANCKAEEWSEIIAGDYEKALTRIYEKGEKIDVFLIDPPYKEGLYDNCFALIREYNLLSDYGIIIAEHDIKDEMPDNMSGYVKLKDRSYGRICLSVFISEESDEGESEV